MKMDVGESTPLRRGPSSTWWRGVLLVSTVAGALAAVGLSRQSFSTPNSLALDAAQAWAPISRAAPAARPERLPPAAADDVSWATYKSQFGKTYASPNEEAARRTYFESRMSNLRLRNARNGAAVFGVTEHSDREAANAFKRGFRPRADRGDRIAAGVPLADDSFFASHRQDKLDAARLALPVQTELATQLDFAVVDWSLVEGVLTPVKNQGQCGSCWAFSATSQVESTAVLLGAPPVTLSTQQVTSCTIVQAELRDGETITECCFGCDGGDVSLAFEKLMDVQTVGLAPDALWPYAQGLTPEYECVAASCTKPCDVDLDQLEADFSYIGPYATVTDYKYAVKPCAGACENQAMAQLAKAVASTPVSVCLNAAAWDDYVGGVLTANECGGFASTDIDHCVQLVGYNAAADAPYWIVRNSWSAEWGVEGYIYLEMAPTLNTCGLADEAAVAEVVPVLTQPP